jgi:hypothetical protein
MSAATRRLPVKKKHPWRKATVTGPESAHAIARREAKVAAALAGAPDLPWACMGCWLFGLHPCETCKHQENQSQKPVDKDA